MIARYRPTIKPPFSLHDRIVQEIADAGSSVCLFFEEGSLTIEDVDPDFVAVLLLRPEKERGAFEGKRMSLKHFLERYTEYSFELVDELYGYHTLTYSGYLNLPDDDSLIEMSLEVYYSGELVYDTES